MLHTSILSLLMLLAPTLPSLPKTPKLIDTCPIATADATATLGVANDGDAAEYYGRGYEAGGRTCRRFVTDFAVAPNAAPESPNRFAHFEVDGGIASHAMPTNATECLKLTVTTTIYKKAAGQSSFAKVGSSVQKGIWQAGGPSGGFSNGGACSLANKSGSRVTGSPNAAGQDIYRTAVHTNVAGAARGVRASIEFAVNAPS
jgi:hypothetical protein